MKRTSTVGILAIAGIIYAIAGAAVEAEERAMAVIQDFRDGVSGIHVRNPEMKVQLTEDPDAPDEPVLRVDYPPAKDDPAGRDVWCDAIDRDWSGGAAISFSARPGMPLRLSVSFLGRNGVAYTSWADLKGWEWQTVRIPIDGIRPNPYFQPPGADRNSPIDVTDVARIGFAPQSPEAGTLMVTPISVVN